MKTNHIQTGQVAYCLLVDGMVKIQTTKFVNVVCTGCPYLAGDAQGGGVECLWDSGSNVAVVEDPGVAALAMRGYDAIDNNIELGPRHRASPIYREYRQAQKARMVLQLKGALNAG